MPVQYEFPRTSLTVDVALFSMDQWLPAVLLIRRGRLPFKGRWALPGGFVDEGEDPVAAAAREVVEETSMAVRTLYPIGFYGAPGRDPRGHVVSAIFLAGATECSGQQAGDDAANARWFDPWDPPVMAFDHHEVLSNCVDAAARMMVFGDLLFDILGDPFTVYGLERVVKAFGVNAFLRGFSPAGYLAGLQEAGLAINHGGAWSLAPEFHLAPGSAKSLISDLEWSRSTPGPGPAQYIF